jgi:hypothetical protein
MGNVSSEGISLISRNCIVSRTELRTIAAASIAWFSSGCACPGCFHRYDESAQRKIS